MAKITEKKLQQLVEEELRAVLKETAARRGGPRQRPDDYIIPADVEDRPSIAPSKDKEKGKGKGKGERGPCRREDCINNDGTFNKKNPSQSGVDMVLTGECVGQEEKFRKKIRARFISVFEKIGIPYYNNLIARCNMEGWNVSKVPWVGGGSAMYGFTKYKFERTPENLFVYRTIRDNMQFTQFQTSGGRLKGVGIKDPMLMAEIITPFIIKVYFSDLFPKSCCCWMLDLSFKLRDSVREAIWFRCAEIIQYLSARRGEAPLRPQDPTPIGGDNEALGTRTQKRIYRCGGEERAPPEEFIRF